MSRSSRITIAIVAAAIALLAAKLVFLYAEATTSVIAESKAEHLVNLVKAEGRFAEDRTAITENGNTTIVIMIGDNDAEQAQQPYEDELSEIALMDGFDMTVYEYLLSGELVLVFVEVA